jgi:hypothetical protein
MLTLAQETTLVAALKASTDQTLAPLVTARDNVLIADWLNTLSTTTAWNEAMSARDLFEAMDVTKFDSVVAGKRESWRLFLDFAPHDFGKPVIRKVIEDVWGTTDGVAILQACTRKATNGELMLGGSTETRNTVSALDLNKEGPFSINDVSVAFNHNP